MENKETRHVSVYYEGISDAEMERIRRIRWEPNKNPDYQNWEGTVLSGKLSFMIAGWLFVAGFLFLIGYLIYLEKHVGL